MNYSKYVSAKATPQMLSTLDENAIKSLFDGFIVAVDVMTPNHSELFILTLVSKLKSDEALVDFSRQYAK